MEKEEAVEIAKKVAKEHNWTWLEPVHAELQDTKKQQPELKD
jgi:hypothetical protein